MKDYTWRCDCEAERSAQKLSIAKQEAKEHVKTCGKTVLIDEYDHNKGELSDKYWKIK